MTTHRRRFLRLCGVAGIGVIAGCSAGSGDGTPTVDRATPTATETPTAAETTTETAPPVQNFTQQAKLVPDDGDSDDSFGRSVTLSSDGTTALIGAYEDEAPNGQFAGSAYVFDRSGGSWTQQAKLAADDGDRDDRFGQSVTLSSDGTTALVGANNDEDPNGNGDSAFDGAGSAYVFE